MERTESTEEVIPTIRLLWLHTSPHLPSKIQESMDHIKQMSDTADIHDICYLEKSDGENYIPPNVKETLADDPFCYLIILMEGPEETQSKRSFQILGELEELVKQPNINPRQIQCHFPIYAGPSIYRKRNIETDKIVTKELHKLNVIPVSAARVPRDLAIGRRTCWRESTYDIYKAIRRQFSYDSMKFWKTKAELRPLLKHQSQATFINDKFAVRKTLCNHCGGGHRTHQCDGAYQAQVQPSRATRWENQSLKVHADLQRSTTQLTPEQEEIGVDNPDNTREVASKTAIHSKNNVDRDPKKKKPRKEVQCTMYYGLRGAPIGSQNRGDGQDTQAVGKVSAPEPVVTTTPMEEDHIDEKLPVGGGQFAQSKMAKAISEPQPKLGVEVKQEPTDEEMVAVKTEKVCPAPRTVIHNPPGISEIYDNIYYTGPKTSNTNV